MRILLHSKIEGVIKDKNLDYEGSITIPKEIMNTQDILVGEQVHVFNKETGERFITYAISGDRFCLNGATARLGAIGDRIIILTYQII